MEQSPTIKTEKRVKILERENALLNSIIQSATDSIYAKNLEGKYISINEAGAAFLNRTVNEVIGKTDKDLFEAEESAFFLRHDLELFRTKKSSVYVSTNTCNGKTRYFRTNKSALLDTNGKMIGLIGVSRDITAEHLTYQKYQFIFENAPIAFWEEDFSEVKIYLDKLKSQGVKNFEEYFDKHPQVVEDCISRIRILNVNRATLKMYDTEDKALFVQKLKRNFSPASEKIFNQEFAALANGQTTFEADGVLVNEDGAERNVLFKLNVLPEHKNDLSLVLISMVDVTDIGQLTNELDRVKYRYQSIVDEQTEMICRIGPNRKVFFRNPAFTRFFRFKDSENLRFASLFPPYEVEKCESNFQQFSVAQPLQTCELQNYNEDGNMVWQQWSIRAFYSKLGVLLGYQSVGTDITEKKNAELALAASEARWRTIFEQADDLIMTVNSDGFVLSFNNYQNLKWSGKNLLDTMLPENGERVLRVLKTVFERKKRLKTEMKIYDRKGEFAYFSCRATPIFNGSRVLSVAVIARDITETKEIEKNTKQALVEGQESERTRVSRELHDGLGQLFTAIKLNLQELTSESERSKTCHLTQRLSTLEENIGTAIREVKNISRNLMPDVLEQFGLLPALEDLVYEWKRTAKMKISLEMTEMDIRLAPETEKGLFRIAQELMNNAVQHSNATHIFVQMINHENSILLMVEDDGVGYDSETVVRGFGLKNIRSRAELLDGNVEVDSGAKRGTITTIEIPLRKKHRNP